MRPLVRRLSALALPLLLASSLAACGGGGIGGMIDSIAKGGGNSSPPPAGGTSAATMTEAEQADADAVLVLVNQERAKSGLRALALDTAAAEAAYGHAVDMDARQYFDHNSPDGTTPSQRMAAAGCLFHGWGENIAMGQPTPLDVMTAWMNSPGHRANIMNAGFTHLGVGCRYARGTVYWVQDFVSR